MRRHGWWAALAALAVITASADLAGGAARNHDGRMQMQDTTHQVPASIKAEHEELQAALARATRYPGRVGEAARDLAATLHPHFVREEQVALPPLALLRPLAQGKFSPGMEDVLPMTDSLRQELPRMLQEHQAIAASARRLAQVARAARAAEVARFADALLNHARMEEEVLYPTAILVGDIIRAQEKVGT